MVYCFPFYSYILYLSCFSFTPHPAFCCSLHLRTRLIFLHKAVGAHTVYSYSNTSVHTCFRIPAAISWPQSKMIWNSFPLFISFKSGLASLVSAGSCRIFRRILYRDGAFISSCNRIRPVKKTTKINTFYYLLPWRAITV